MIFQIKDGMKKLSYILALLGPLYASAILVRVILDVLLPENRIFRFFELGLPAVAEIYAAAILFLAIKKFYKLPDLKALVVTALPWVLILIYNLI